MNGISVTSNDRNDEEYDDDDIDENNGITEGPGNHQSLHTFPQQSAQVSSSRAPVLPSYDDIKSQDDVYYDITSGQHAEGTKISRSGEERIIEGESEGTEEGGGDGREDYIHCFLCGALYNKPKILPCLHAFCLRCLQEYESRHQELQPVRKKINGNKSVGEHEYDDDEADDDSSVSDGLPCPRCKRVFQVPDAPQGPVGGGGLQALPDHIFYSRLANLHRQGSHQGGGLSPGGTSSPGGGGPEITREPDLCSVCGTDWEGEDEGSPNDIIASYACLDCQEKLCADCARAHKKQTLSRGHTVRPVTTDPMFVTPPTSPPLSQGSGGDEKLNVDQFPMCDKHPQEKVSLYCSDCLVPVCKRCIQVCHGGHATCDVTSVATRGRLNLEDGLERIYGRIEAFHQLKQSMAKQQDSFLQQVDDAHAAIRAAADEMRREVDMYEEQLIRETLAIRDNTVQELAKVYDEVDDDYDALNTLRDLSEHLLADGNDSDIALLSGRVLARRRQLESTNHDVSVCSVKFRPCPPSKVNPLGKVAILDIDSSDPYIDSPEVISVIAGTESVAGVALLDGELYIVRDLTPFVDVYNAISFAPIRRLRLDGLRKPADVTSSSANQSLYVSDSTGHVYCLQPHGQILIRWQCDGEPSGLYVCPSNGNVLVTCYDSRLIKEFTQDGSHVRTIRLQQDMANPSHTILVDSDKLIICHGWESGKLHRVCYIDSIGRTTRTYGGSNGSGSGRMDSPARLALDPFGYVFVLDRNNDRVQLLSPNLIHVRDLIGRGHFGARQPRRMCLDAANGCLYVGMIDGRVIAFRILDA